ncbi:hypothetical protein BKA70DRAFT_1215082 [Coprinopsis sp. MPI-PUGE-AT-0042]|nr:hypothetical protein BKA70DRAFT_1215082 [Coprinopsis sp. MPI-PUGE-AT-0042]
MLALRGLPGTTAQHLTSGPATYHEPSVLKDSQQHLYQNSGKTANAERRDGRSLTIGVHFESEDRNQQLSLVPPAARSSPPTPTEDTHAVSTLPEARLSPSQTQNAALHLHDTIRVQQKQIADLHIRMRKLEHQRSYYREKAIEFREQHTHELALSRSLMQALLQLREQSGRGESMSRPHVLQQPKPWSYSSLLRDPAVNFEGLEPKIESRDDKMRQRSDKIHRLILTCHMRTALRVSQTPDPTVLPTPTRHPDITTLRPTGTTVQTEISMRGQFKHGKALWPTAIRGLYSKNKVGVKMAPISRFLERNKRAHHGSILLCIFAPKRCERSEQDKLPLLQAYSQGQWLGCHFMAFALKIDGLNERLTVGSTEAMDDDTRARKGTWLNHQRRASGTISKLES